MARTRKYNENMGELSEAISEYMNSQQSVRARYMALAEQELAARRDKVFELMFVVHSEAGPSEIANSTGISRSTVIRWRDEFMAERGALIEQGNAAHAAVEAGASDGGSAGTTFSEDVTYEFGSEAYDGNPTAYIQETMPDGQPGERLYLLTGEDFGLGNSPHEAEDNKIDRPDWLTDDVMRQAVDATGVKLMLAPWKN